MIEDDRMRMKCMSVLMRDSGHRADNEAASFGIRWLSKRRKDEEKGRRNEKRG
jgi:hypothetical protein